MQYSDIEPDKSVGISFPIDITGDSVADFTFLRIVNWGERIAKLTSHNGYEFNVSGNYVDTLNFENSITDTLDWVAGTRQFVYYLGNDHQGTWVNVNNKFVGIRIPSEKGWKYGWFRLNIIDNNITIKDYAISTIAGMEIFAGEALPPVARNVEALDVSNFKDGRDLRVKADVEINEYLVDEYRIICVKTDSASTFGLYQALALTVERYKSLAPAGNTIEITYDSLSLDSDGDPIQEFVPYTVFILSVTPNSPGSPDPCLSLPSNSIVLISYAGTAYNINVAKEYNHDLTFTLNASFTVPANEEGIVEYRLLFVKEEDYAGFTIDTAFNVSPDYYFAFNPNGQNHSISLITSDIFDYKGNNIYNTEYWVFILSIADGEICNAHTMNRSEVFSLILETPKVENILISDNGDNSNAGDITITFDSVNESQIDAYKAILVKESEVSDFTIQKAESLEDGCWFNIYPSNSNINISLPAEMKDSQGDMIYEDSVYRVFILTLADTVNTNMNNLSDASNIVAIATPDHFKAGQKMGTNVFYYDIEPDVELFPIKEILTYYFDLNGDGTDDYYIRASHESSPSFFEVQSWCIPLNGNEVNVYGANTNALDFLDSAFMISRNLQWQNSEAAFFYGFAGMVPGSSFSWGVWSGIGFKYLGLKMFDESDTIYGWLNLKVNGGIVSINAFASRPELPDNIDENNNRLIIYPNPAVGILNVVIPNGYSGRGSYEIIDMHGKVAAHGNLSGNTYSSIEVSYLKNGIYVICIKTSDEVFNNRIAIW